MTTMRVASPSALSNHGDLTKAVLLGVLRNGPMHGYLIKQTLHEWYMDFWADVKPGSIYAGLKRLVADGFIEETGIDRSGNRPLRTTYKITKTGRAELHRLLRIFWTPPNRIARSVDIALQFVNELPATEIAPLIEERLQALENQIALFGPGLRPRFDNAGRQARVDDLHEHELYHLKADRDWCKHVLKQIREGAYADDGPPHGGGKRRTK